MEHGIVCYYGKLGSGKTYAMTQDILRLLDSGHVVYTNYKIEWHGKRFRPTLDDFFRKWFLKKPILVSMYPESNLRYIETDENFHQRFGELRDCIVALDEAYVLFDSYKMAKMLMSERMNILQTRKAHRSIYYTAQRPSSVHVTMRAMTNIFYRCDKMKFPWFLLFRRTEYDLSGSSDATIDEEKSLGTKIYFGTKRGFESYDTDEFIGARSNAVVDDLPRMVQVPYTSQ